MLRKRRDTLYLRKEWPRRSKVVLLWLENGDENKKCFHSCSNHRKNINSICSMKRLNGSLITRLKDLASLSVNYVKCIFNKDERVFIVGIIRMDNYFPSFFFDDENASLMEVVSKEELQVVFHSFQNNKRLMKNAWLVHIFLIFYEILEDTLRVIEKYKISSQIMTSSNTTFNVFLPKSYNLSSFEEYRPILLWNYAYKMI